MSRCFPFPPPGYEKKPWTDDVDLLKKEKHREKKHKKEKKESKEKREKDRSDGKHKEKKGKKEKHKDKRKDKEKDSDKDKEKNTADEKRLLGLPESSNADRLTQRENKQKDGNSILSQEKFDRLYAGYNGEKFGENACLAEEIKHSKFVQELDRRIKDEDGGAGNHVDQKLPIPEHKKDEGTVRLVAKGADPCPRVKKFKDKIVDNRKSDGQGSSVETRPTGNAMLPNHVGSFHPIVEEMPRLLGKSSDKTREGMVEGKEKSKEKKIEEKQRDKTRDKSKDKKERRKDKERDKEKKKEEKAKEDIKQKNKEQNKLKETKKGDSTDAISFPHPPKDSFKNAVIEENLKKRKDINSNGVLHANDNKPNKLPRPSSSLQFKENGRILEACQTSIPYTSDKHVASIDPKVDIEKSKPNGIREAVSSSFPSSKVTATTALTDQRAEARVKPPHPDTKCLSQVYSVPKMEDYSDFDDQEWLFSCGRISQVAKPNVESSDSEIPQVWAEALQIEPADVYALPYVLPY